MKNVTSLLLIGILLILIAGVANAAKFSIGDAVRTITNLNVRSEAGSSYEIADPDYPGYAPARTLGKIVDGPVTANYQGNSYIWWKVDFGPGLYSGWSVEAGLEKVSQSPSLSSSSSMAKEVPKSPYYPNSNKDWWQYQFAGYPDLSNHNCGPACTAMVISYLKGNPVSTQYGSFRDKNFPKVHCAARGNYIGKKYGGKVVGGYSFDDCSDPGATTKQIQKVLEYEGIQTHLITGYDCYNGTGITKLQSAIDQGKVCIVRVVLHEYQVGSPDSPKWNSENWKKWKEADHPNYHDWKSLTHWVVVYGYDDNYIYLNDPGYRNGKGYRSPKDRFADAMWDTPELSTIIVCDTQVPTLNQAPKIEIIRKSILDQYSTYKYLFDTGSIKGAISTVWASITAPILGEDLIETYEKFYYTALDYLWMASLSLKYASHFLDAGDYIKAEKYIKEAKRYRDLSNDNYRASCQVYQGNLGAAVELARGIYNASKAAVKFGSHVMLGPWASKVFDGLFSITDFAVEQCDAGWSEAIKNALIQEIVEIMFDDIEFDFLDNKTISEAIGKEITKSIGSARFHFILSKMLEQRNFNETLMSSVVKASSRLGLDISKDVVSSICRNLIETMETAMKIETLHEINVGNGSPSDSIKQQFIAAYLGKLIMGAPVNDVHLWGSFWVQDFPPTPGFGKSIMIYNPELDKVFIVHGEIWEKVYKPMGGPNSWLGPPIGNEENYPVADSASNVIQRFKYGYITHLPGSDPYRKAYPNTCQDKVTFVSENYPDGTVISAGSSFKKRWTVKNLGTCDWNGYRLVWVSGDKLGARDYVPIPFTQSGSQVDLEVAMVAPKAPGTYKSYWRVQREPGVFVPGENTGLLRVEIVVKTPSTPTEGSLVKTAGTDKVYLFKGGRKWWIVNTGIFNKLGFDSSKIVDYPQGILDIYPNGPAIVAEGSLLRRKGTKRVYLIENGQRRWVVSSQVFNMLGFKWEDVYDVPYDQWDALISLFPQGPDITIPPTNDTISPLVSIGSPTGGESWLSGSQYTITWKASDDVGIDHINIYYTTDGWLSSSEIASNLPNTGSYLWTTPAVNTNNAAIRVVAYDKSGNVGYDHSGTFLISERIIEKPYAPHLYGLGIKATRNQVTLRWRKVVDSNYKDNVSYYEIEYADNSSFSNAIRLNAGNPATGANIYETISYTVTGLEDDKTYYFRVRAINDAGTSPWSNYESIRVEIQDYPYFDESYQEPANRATNVSKTPILRWRAYDPDGDNLDYYVALGTDANNVDYPLRAFRSDHEGQNWFDFSEEYHKPLKPGTTYYWQIWVREEGHYKDYYGGEYIKSPVWHFTTVSTGSDLAITSVEREGEIKPGSTVNLKVTVKNLGSETAKARSIKCSYIKNGSESPFWIGGGYMHRDLLPGQEEVVNVSVQFRDRVWKSNGVIYDNVLVSGESQIRFYFANKDDQDVNRANNEFTYTINYVDAGGPVITYFDIREHGSMYEDWGIPFWARMGEKLKIIVVAKDDVMTTKGIVQYRLHTNDSWTTISTQLNEFPDLSRSFEWEIPSDIKPTDEAQVRILLYDDKGNETIKTSKHFSIYSNRIDADIQPILATYSVGQDITYKITVDSDNDISDIKVRLLYGSGSATIYSEQNDNGIVIAPQYQWKIPDKNYYSSQNCYLELEITDIRGNKKTVRSERFRIDANTELPSPFNNAIILYDEEFNFPPDALHKEQSRNIKFVKLDESNIVHAVIEHMYRYYQDTASGDKEDKLVYVNNKYYITYDTLSDTISSKIKVCDKNYEVVDFEIFKGTPYALLKGSDGREQYYYTYKNGSSFVEPIIIENRNVPRIKNMLKIDDLGDSSYTLSDPTKHILLNGYIWDLDGVGDAIRRYPFSNGYIGDKETINIQNRAGYVENFWIKPTSDGNVIYFIYPRGSKLVKFDTVSLVATSYQLPFTVGKERSDAAKTSIAALGGRVFIFANGKVYTLEGENIIEKAHIAYTFDGETVDYADKWNYVRYSKTIKTGDKIYLIMYGHFFSQARPTRTSYEILEFDPQSYTFSKNVVQTRQAGFCVSSDSFDIEYIGNNKVLTAVAKDISQSHELNNYFSYLNMLDLETGDIIHIGQLPFKAKDHISLICIGGKIYAIAQNSENHHSEFYRLKVENLELRPNQVTGIQFLQHNDHLYVAWAGGHPYDGTWNSTEKRVSNYLLRKNKFIQIYPSLGSITDFSDQYIGYSPLNVVEHYLSSSDGKLYSLNSDLTVDQKLYDMECSNPLEFKSFGSTFIAAFNKYNNGKMDFTLFKDDLSRVTFDSLTQSNEVASFDNEVIFVGYGYGPYQSKNVVTKLDLSSGEKSIIAFGWADTSYNYRKVDINKNKYVAVAWSNYLAVADLSGDIVQPRLNISDSGGQITDGSTVTLSWQASDNQDELKKYEIYKIVNGTSTLLDTINDVSITSYNYTLSEEGASEITFKIIAYDYDGNASYDTVTYNIIPPVQFISFLVNKSTVQLGEKLVFSWSANGTDDNTVYTIYKRKSGSSGWQEYFQVTGETSKIISVEGFIGEYEFKIEAGKDSMELSHTVLIEGEIVEFDYTRFFPKNKAYYVNDRIIEFGWGVAYGLSEAPIYELYIKNNEEKKFSRVITTSDTIYQHVFPEKTTAFDWKVVAHYHGMRYESKEFHVKLKEIVSPDVTSVNLKNNNTDDPSVEIHFDAIEGIDEYVIVRRSSSGVYKKLATISGNSYVDNTVEYEEYYEYTVLSKVGDLCGAAGKSQGIFVQIKEIGAITIQNENYTFLNGNEITVNFAPDSDDCYEKYEVLIGTSRDSMDLFAITRERSIHINKLGYNTTYYINIYPLDYKNDRLTNLPATLVFTTPPEPVPASPSGLVANSNPSGGVDLSWTDNSNNGTGFKIERKIGASGNWSQIYVVGVGTTTFSDTGLEPNKTYYYRIRAYNSSGNSDYSNEVCATTLSIKGDMNGDGKIDLRDAIIALQVLSGITPSQAVNLAADVNGDGKIGLSEVIFIMQRISGL